MGAKNIINLISVVNIWWCPCVESSLVCWKMVFAMTSVFSWQNSVSLLPASFCTLRPNFPITPGISWLLTFAFQSPIMKRISFFGASSRRFFYIFIKYSTSASSAFITGWGIDLDYCDIIWLALEMNRDHFVILGTATKYSIWTLLLTMMATPLLLSDSCQQQ